MQSHRCFTLLSLSLSECVKAESQVKAGERVIYDPDIPRFKLEVAKEKEEEEEEIPQESCDKVQVWK